MEIADKEYGRKLLERFGVPTTAKMVMGVSVRRSKDTSPAFEEAVARLCDYAYKKYGCYPVFIPMQANKDEGISRAVMAKMKTDSAIVDVRLDVPGMVSLVSALDLCIGMRLHSLIYATSSRVPLIGLAYDPKIKSFMDYAGQQMWLEVKNLDVAEGEKLIDKCIAEYDKINEDLSRCYKELNKKALSNGSLAIELYESEGGGKR
jgi:polysaccharide pyruvyl transferase WcaK-like protein